MREREREKPTASLYVKPALFPHSKNTERGGSGGGGRLSFPRKDKRSVDPRAPFCPERGRLYITRPPGTHYITALVRGLSLYQLRAGQEATRARDRIRKREYLKIYFRARAAFELVVL